MRAETEQAWPPLPLREWQDTYATLHMWTQIVGKVRLALTPRVNHWWNVPLYVSARGLTTSAMPYRGRQLEISFDFLSHELVLDANDGVHRTMPLAPRPVAEFYRDFLDLLHAAGVEAHIWPMPVEVPNPIP